MEVSSLKLTVPLPATSRNRRKPVLLNFSCLRVAGDHMKQKDLLSRELALLVSNFIYSNRNKEKE